jgi:uncharacterized protein
MAIPDRRETTMSTFAVIYTYVEDSDAQRDAHRPAHRDFLRGLHDAGRLRASGPFGAGVTAGALLLLEGGSADEVGTLLDDDPFREAGVLADRSIRPWDIVIGGIG